MSQTLQDLFSNLDPVGRKMRFHLRAGMSFTGIVDRAHRDANGGIRVIELVPGHRSMGEILYIAFDEVCAIAFVAEPAIAAGAGRHRGSTASAAAAVTA